MLNVGDEFTHEALEILISRRIRLADGIDVLLDLFILRGVPCHIHSYNGPGFVAKAVKELVRAVETPIPHIMHGSPWENGFVEFFNPRLRDELLDGDLQIALRRAQYKINLASALQHGSVTPIAWL